MTPRSVPFGTVCRPHATAKTDLHVPDSIPAQVGRLNLPRVVDLPVDYRRPYGLGAGPLRSRNTVANASAIVSGSIRQTTPHIASG